MDEKKRAHLIIFGRVQGVFFRAETQRAANQIGASGWVRNKMDGTVEAVVEGDANKVIETIEWCKKGSPRSHVEKVDVTWQEYKNEFNGFSVRY